MPLTIYSVLAYCRYHQEHGKSLSNVRGSCPFRVGLSERFKVGSKARKIPRKGKKLRT